MKQQGLLHFVLLCGMRTSGSGYSIIKVLELIVFIYTMISPIRHCFAL